MGTVETYLGQIGATLKELPLDKIKETITVLNYARQNDRQVFIMGNGGSAATASHFASDLAKGAIAPDGARFRAISLVDNMAIFSALANDIGYENVFSEQLTNLARPGDIVIGISGSGRSANIVKAIELAKSIGAVTIGLTGFDGGQLKELVDICIIVPSHSMQQVEDCHLILQHMMCSCLRNGDGYENYPLPDFIASKLTGLAPKSSQ